MTNRLREWRKRRGKNLEEIAYLVGCSPGYLSRMESGKRNVSLAFLKRVAVALSVSEADLVSEDFSNRETSVDL